MAIGPDEPYAFEYELYGPDGRMGLLEWQRRVCQGIDQANAGLTHDLGSFMTNPRFGPVPYVEIVDETQDLNRHRYRQDPLYVVEKICADCGMWPLFHTHWESNGCNCAECDPEGYRWESQGESPVLPGYGDDFMFGHASADDRPHP